MNIGIVDIIDGTQVKSDIYRPWFVYLRRLIWVFVRYNGIGSFIREVQ